MECTILTWIIFCHNYSFGSFNTGITNSSGVAEVTVTGVSGTVTFTCTYSNVSAQCTVTAQTYLFFDDCSTDRSNEYSRIASRGNATITYDNNGYYILQEISSNQDCGFLIPAIVVGSDVKISAKVNHQTSGNLQSGVGFYNNSTGMSWCGRIVRVNNTISLNREYNDSSQGSTSLSTSNNVWYLIEMEYTNNSAIGFKVYSNDGTLLKSITGTQSDLSTNNNSPYLRLSRDSGSIIWIKDIKVESL